MNIYVSNLSSGISNEGLGKMFSGFGEVKSAEIAIDVFTGQSRGFGYVEMPDDSDAEKAIGSLHESEIEGLKISVEQAKPKEVHKGSYKVGDGAVNIYRFKKN